MSTVIDNGLIVDNATTPPTAVGYIFNFGGKGAYAPNGLVKVGDTDLTQAQVDEHNRLLGEMEMEHAKQTGKAFLYFSYTIDPPYTPQNPRWQGGRTYKDFRVSNWAGTWKSPRAYATKSFTPGFNCGERWHVYFTGPDGKKWYGINQGNNQIVRARRLKNQK